MTETTLPYNPGGKVSIPLPAGVAGSAKFSKCGRYRGELWRVWGDPADYILFIGMNPSTASHEADDPTCQREWTRARSFGAGAYCKANILDIRLTDSKQLPSCGIEPCSPQNLPTILCLAKDAKLIVMACGVLPKPLQENAYQTIRLLRAEGHSLWCLGMTKDGFPKHPLYLRADAPLIEYQPHY